MPPHAFGTSATLLLALRGQEPRQKQAGIGHRGRSEKILLFERIDYFSAMTLTAVLTPDSVGGYVAQNPETGTTTQGVSVADALANLKEATELYLEEFPFEAHAPSLMTTFEVAHA